MHPKCVVATDALIINAAAKFWGSESCRPVTLRTFLSTCGKREDNYEQLSSFTNSTLAIADLLV